MRARVFCKRKVDPAAASGPDAHKFFFAKDYELAGETRGETVEEVRENFRTPEGRRVMSGDIIYMEDFYWFMLPSNMSRIIIPNKETKALWGLVTDRIYADPRI